MISFGHKYPGEGMRAACVRACEEQGIDPKYACFSGKLDPLADGVFGIAYSKNKKEKTETIERMHKYNKTYKYSFVVDIDRGAYTTDSTAILGLPSRDFSDGAISAFEQIVIEETGESVPYYTIILSNIIESLERLNDCTFVQKANRFSAKKVKGKCVWEWSTEGRFDEISHLIPTREVTVYETNILSTRVRDARDVYEEFMAKLDTLPSGPPVDTGTGTHLSCGKGTGTHPSCEKDVKKMSKKRKRESRPDPFRALEAKEKWTERFNMLHDGASMVEFTVQSTVSSGTFIRQLVRDIADECKVNLIVTRITRTKIFE